MHFILLVGVLLALSCTGIVMVVALDAGEVMALTDMQQEWGSRLRWTGSPSCNWNYLYCDSNGHVYLLYVHIIFREFLLSHILRYSWNTNHYFPLIYFSTQTPNLIFMITNYSNIIIILLFFIFIILLCFFLQRLFFISIDRYNSRFYWKYSSSQRVVCSKSKMKYKNNQQK